MLVFQNVILKCSFATGERLREKFTDEEFFSMTNISIIPNPYQPDCLGRTFHTFLNNF